jgi:hypothetical protein
MNCKICNTKTEILFNQKTLLLNKHVIDYYRCKKCGFIQTEEPFWLDEAYNSAITSLDIGLVSRNIHTSQVLSSLIFGLFDKKGSFLDYGGGYGMLVRIMRDLGYDFYRYDTHCENLFSVHFDLANKTIKKFELVTAFELFEHLLDPIQETAKMLEFSDSIFFSTELIPDRDLKSPNDWWYFAQETGQHIALYSSESLRVIAEKLGCNFYTNGKTLHLITKRKISPFLFNFFLRGKVSSSISTFFKQKSLLNNDFDEIRKMLNQS